MWRRWRYFYVLSFYLRSQVRLQRALYTMLEIKLTQDQVNYLSSSDTPKQFVLIASIPNVPYLEGVGTIIVFRLEF